MGKQLMFLSEDNSSKMANTGLHIQNAAHQNSSWPFLSFIFVFLPEIDKLIPKLICRGMQATTTTQIIYQIKNEVRDVTFPKSTVYCSGMAMEIASSAMRTVHREPAQSVRTTVCS